MAIGWRPLGLANLVSKNYYQVRDKSGNFELAQWWQPCTYILKSVYLLQKPASVAQLDAPSDWRPGGRGFNPRRGRQHSFVRLIMKYFLRSFSPFR